MESRGIVTLAGGKIYFLNAFINLKILRELGCKLPFEWFYLGDEMTDKMKEKAMEITNIKLIDLGGTGDKTQGRGGWQNKVESVINSSFDEILFLDADSFPLRDPEYLFDHPFFKDTGAVFWPDPFFWDAQGLANIKRIFGVDVPARQIESGQMMFRKPRCMPGLLKTRELNKNSEITYRYLYGDKDTFIIGATQAGGDYKMAPFTYDGLFPVGMLHKDFDGKPMFVHLAGGKWRIHGRPFVRKEVYPMQQRAIQITRELQPILI